MVGVLANTEVNPGGYAVHEVSPGEYALWNLEVANCPAATLFHTTTFYEAFGEFAVWLVKRKSNWVAGLIVAVDGKTTGRPAFVPYTGFVLFETTGSLSGRYASIHESFKLLSAVLLRKFDKVNLRLAPAIQDVQQLIWQGFDVRLRYTYLVDIADLEDTYRKFDDNIKRQINKAVKLGLRASFSSQAADSLEMFRATREHPDSHLDLLRRYQEFLSREQSSSTVVITDQAGLALAAVFVVWDRHRAYYLLGGYRKTSAEDNRSYTAFALWQAMQFAHQHAGVKEFDLEGSMIPGVENFFRKFGGRKVPYFELVYTKKNLGYFLSRIRKAIFT